MDYRIEGKFDSPPDHQGAAHRTPTLPNGPARTLTAFPIRAAVRLLFALVALCSIVALPGLGGVAHAQTMPELTITPATNGVANEDVWDFRVCMMLSQTSDQDERARWPCRRSRLGRTA